MPEPFDPYYKWLGIPPAQQPPHHYRLLGIELFESDVEVIDMAANQRMSYLQEMAGGTYGKESQRLLNEVSAARRCLLDKSAKAAYDEQLRAKAPKPATDVTESDPPDGDEDDTVNISPTVNIAIGKLGSKPAKSPTTKPAAEGDTSFDFKINDSKGAKAGKSKLTVAKSTPSKPVKASGSKSGTKASPAPAGGEAAASDSGKRRKKKSRLVPVALTAVVLAAAGGGGYEYYRRSLAPKAESQAVAVATTPAATATSTGAPLADASPSTPAPTVASTAPSASPSSTAGAAALEMFNSALKSQTPTELQSASGGVAPSATPKPSVTKSPIVAAAEAAPATEFFLGGAAPNVASQGVHLQPQRNVLGRLVGFFKSGAEYHLFYETVAIARRAGTDVWGHAVSADLLTWREVPLTAALDPKRPAALGSIFVDAENVSKLGEAGKPVWLAACAFSDAKKTEIGYASSLDQGATWTFAKEPVLKGLSAETRWPRIVRDAERKQWCLVALTKQVAKPPATTYTLFTSPDLKTWTKRQDVPLSNGTGAPEFFEVAEPSPGKARRWIFAAGNGRYMLGQFDGERFTSDNRGGQLFVDGYRWFRTLDDSAGEKRRLATAVVAAPDSAKQPAHGMAVALPQVLSLTGGEAAFALSPADCDELQSLAGKATEHAGDLPAGAPLTVKDCGPIYRFSVLVEAGQAEAVEITLFGEMIRFDFKAKTRTIGDETTPHEATSVKLQGIVDREIAELWTPAGRVAFSTRSGPGVVPFELEAIGGTAKLQAVRVAPLVRPAGKP
jgi:sucrose-6-phosphate hydrolase SacC (GH32 family)